MMQLERYPQCQHDMSQAQIMRGQPEPTRTMRRHTGNRSVNAVAFFNIWDVKSRRKVLRPPVKRTCCANSVFFSPDVKRPVVVWNAELKTASVHSTLNRSRDHAIRVWSPSDAQQLVTASANYTAKFWDSSNGEHPSESDEPDEASESDEEEDAYEDEDPYGDEGSQSGGDDSYGGDDPYGGEGSQSGGDDPYGGGDSQSGGEDPYGGDSQSGSEDPDEGGDDDDQDDDQDSDQDDDQDDDQDSDQDDDQDSDQDEDDGDEDEGQGQDEDKVEDSDEAPYAGEAYDSEANEVGNTSDINDYEDEDAGEDEDYGEDEDADEDSEVDEASEADEASEVDEASDASEAIDADEADATSEASKSSDAEGASYSDEASDARGALYSDEASDADRALYSDEASDADRALYSGEASDAEAPYIDDSYEPNEAREALDVDENSPSGGDDDLYGSDHNSVDRYEYGVDGYEYGVDGYEYGVDLPTRRYTRAVPDESSIYNGQPSYNIFSTVFNSRNTELLTQEINEDGDDDSYSRRQARNWELPNEHSSRNDPLPRRQSPNCPGPSKHSKNNDLHHRRHPPNYLPPKEDGIKDDPHSRRQSKKDGNNETSHHRRQPQNHPEPDPHPISQPRNRPPPKKDRNNNDPHPKHQAPNHSRPSDPYPRHQPPNHPGLKKVGNNDSHPRHQLEPPSRPGHNGPPPVPQPRNRPPPKKDGNNNNPRPRRQPPSHPEPNDLPPVPPKKDGNSNNPRPRRQPPSHPGPSNPPPVPPKKDRNNNDPHPRRQPPSYPEPNDLPPVPPKKDGNNDNPHPRRQPSSHPGPNDPPPMPQTHNHPPPKKDENNDNPHPRHQLPNRPPPNSEPGKNHENRTHEFHSSITVTWNGQKRHIVRSPDGRLHCPCGRDDHHRYNYHQFKKLLEQPIHPKDGALDYADDKYDGPIRDEGNIANGQSLYDVRIQVFPTVWDASVSGDLHTAEELLTQEIKKDGNNDDSYAIRSVVRARNSEWYSALQDAVKSTSMQPSFWGYISKGIALCGNEQLWDAMEAFDLAITFSDHDPMTIDLLLLIKAVVLFNAGRHNEAFRRVQRLAIADQHLRALPCSMVDSYLRVQLAFITFQNGQYSEAADALTASIPTITSLFSPTTLLEPRWKIFTLLFGWDLDSLWRTVNQQRCDAFLEADRVIEAAKSFQDMMSMIDDNAKSGYIEWSTTFKKKCTAKCVAKGDEAIAASNYEMAVELFSAAIRLDSSHDSFFARRSTAFFARKHYSEALADANTVIKLSPSSHHGSELKDAALRGAQRSDNKANETFESMLSKLKLTDAPDSKIQALRLQYTEAESTIKGVIDAHLEKAPLRLLNTSTGLLCNQEAQINAFMESTEYNELLYSSMTHVPLQMKPIKKAVAKYFSWVMLSHRWDKEEPALHHIQDKDVYKLKGVAGIEKLQKFCKKARGMEYRWAWSDTCCIDQKNTAEVQRSVNSMFVWYRQSALTIVYLSDVPPSAESGALAKSVWITRGWTVQEFLAPKIILFYHKDWSLYLDDHSPNHKKSSTIMQELERSTGINARALVTFNPEMKGAREKLRWASHRVTTVPEDIAYSLFGIFGVQLPVLYGEMKQSALGRLLQEIIARSGDITALDWVGKSSDFNSCLPAEITSYTAPPRTLTSLSTKEMQKYVARLDTTVDVETALRLYTLVDSLSAPRFANSRLHLPCITFAITEVKKKRGEDKETRFTYKVTTDGLQDLSIITEDKLVQFSPTRPTPQAFLLVCPWNRHDFGLPDFANSAKGVKENESDGLDSRSRALKLIVRLGQPFSALLLAQQRGSEYKRIASDYNITAEVKSITAVHDMMGVKMLEVL